MIGLWEPGHRDRDIEIWEYSTFKIKLKSQDWKRMPRFGYY